MYRLPARTPRPRSTRQSGSSLLEVLVAVLVLAIGLLGMAAMSAVTIKNSNSSAARSQAVVHVYSVMDRLRISRVQAAGGAFNVGWQCEAQASDPDAGFDSTLFNGWLAEVQQGLGDAEACGRIACAAESCTVGIRWNDSRATGGDDALEIQTTSRL